jgi:hypothetical protein
MKFKLKKIQRGFIENLNRLILFVLTSCSMLCALAQKDTIIKGNFDFFISISVEDTVPCSCSQLVHEENVPANLLLIKVDSVYGIFNKGIYLNDLEIYKVKYILMPKDIPINRSQNFIITGDQYQKEYFVFYVKTNNPNMVFVQENEDFKDNYGLIFMVKHPFYRRIQYAIFRTPEYKRTHWKKVNKKNDPILKCMKKYEKNQKDNVSF